jgi:hypothetical protein
MENDPCSKHHENRMHLTEYDKGHDPLFLTEGVTKNEDKYASRSNNSSNHKVFKRRKKGRISWNLRRTPAL